MKKLFFFLSSVALLISLFIFSEKAEARQGAGSHRVRPHVRKNGHFVQPHARTNPRNSIPRNNWSTRGNKNPYTGKPGKTDPYR